MAARSAAETTTEESRSCPMIRSFKELQGQPCADHRASHSPERKGVGRSDSVPRAGSDTNLGQRSYLVIVPNRREREREYL
jgi:hypothetical protein